MVICKMSDGRSTLEYLISRISIIIVVLIRANNKSRCELAYKRQRSSKSICISALGYVYLWSD